MQPIKDIAQTWERLAELSKHDAEPEAKPLTFLGLCSHLWTQLRSHTSKS
jgi:hypothetical protein